MAILQNILNMFFTTLCLRWHWEWCVLVIQVPKKLRSAFTCGEKQPYSKVTIRRQKVNRRISLFIIPACTYVLTEGNMFHPFLLTIILVLFFFSIHLFFKGGWSQVLLCLFLHQLHRFDQKRLSREESSEQHTSSLTKSLKSPQLSHIRISFHSLYYASLAFKNGFS